jgi:hypothetical protein
MLQELIAEDRRRIYELEQALSEAEASESSSKVSDVYIALAEMADRLEELGNMAKKESKGRRDDMRRRINHLKNSHMHVQQNLDTLVKRIQSKQASFDRVQLFGKAGEDGNNIESGSGGGWRDRGLVDLEMNEGASLTSSQNMVSGYINLGRDTLAELTAQRGRLKGIHRRVLDIMNYLGISHGIMKTVEGRDMVDKWITYGGMVFITVLLVTIWYYR